MSRVEVNRPAPDFEIKDYLGVPIKLSDYQGKKNVLLVLNRGFVWPFCQKHMMQLHQDFNQYKKMDTEIIVIGPEKPEAFGEYFKKNNLPFRGIPDPEHTILKLYQQEVNLFKLGRMPGQMLIDKKGELRYVHYGHSMKDIPDNQEMFDLIKDFD